MASLMRRACLQSTNFIFPRRTGILGKVQLQQGRNANTSANLMEFFEPEKNWGVNEIRTGRSWAQEELRIKSNSDLHKLWFVLLKEYNILLTMEQAAKDAVQLFPSPERIDKVQESMRNLESVVRERNRAYHVLETGEKGERATTIAFHGLGLKKKYKLREHVFPEHMNGKWQETLRNSCTYKEADEFMRLYREKQTRMRLRHIGIQTNHVKELMKRFPGITREGIKKHYPDVDVEEIFNDSS